ncbi:uncharacterized protein LOC111631462 [Centruroides sculpturatus]|uniref:uncharacterized protein LOC111631462 n=1 Tax=Centruroides sculpturatus TaxID=218467 RepID=UPI000C6F00B6|nr:uncharacterized protein LOC111631462 [Centruroides sculpturatus]
MSVTDQAVEVERSVTFNPYLRSLYAKIVKKHAVCIASGGICLFSPFLIERTLPDYQVYSFPIKNTRCNRALLYIGSTKHSMRTRMQEHILDMQHTRTSTALSTYTADLEIMVDFMCPQHPTRNTSDGWRPLKSLKLTLRHLKEAWQALFDHEGRYIHPNMRAGRGNQPNEINPAAPTHNQWNTPCGNNQYSPEQPKTTVDCNEWEKDHIKEWDKKDCYCRNNRSNDKTGKVNFTNFGNRNRKGNTDAIRTNTYPVRKADK